MTISTDTATASYTGNGVTQIFPVPFYFLVDTDLKVSKKVAATGVVSVLTLNSDYTVSDAGNQAGGSITTLAVPASGDQIFIERNVDAVQETAYPENGPFPAASHEKALDRLTMLVQQLQTADGRALTRDALGLTYDMQGGTLVNSGAAAGPNDVPPLSQVQAIAAGVSAGIVPSTIVTVGSPFIRVKLTSARNYYVRPDGNDNNAGTSNTPGSAWATLQHAADYISNTLDLNGFSVTVYVADGTYTSGARFSVPQSGSGQVYFIGNTSTPASCLVSVNDVACFYAEKGANVYIGGFKVVNAGGEGVYAQTAGFIQCGPMEFGSCANSQVTVGNGGTVYLSADYTITAGSTCSSHLHAGSPGCIFTGVITATVGPGCSYSAYFIGVAQGAVIVKDCTFTSTAVTGPRHLAHKGGVIDAHPAFLNLPGSTQGRQATGGVYRGSQAAPFQIAPDIFDQASVRLQSYNINTQTFTDRVTVNASATDTGYIYINGSGSYAGADGATVSGSGGCEFNIGTPNTVSFSANTRDGYTFQQGFAAVASMTSRSMLECRRQGTDGAVFNFWKGGINPSLVGSVSVTATATAYNTSSDYRLKENERPITDGIDRVMQLRPYRLNFKVTPDETIDSFFAHEVQSVVPNAVRGVKDGMGVNTETGEPEPRYQSLDHSKMVPLLVAAIQDLKRDLDAYKAAQKAVTP